MTRCPTINFQLSIMTKWLAKHINTRVSFNITPRKGHLYIDISLPWTWNQCPFLRIWNDDSTKMIDLPSFQLATRWNSETQMKLSLLMNSDSLICSWILVFPIGIIEFSTSRKCCIWLYFSSLNDYWPPSTWNSLVHTSWFQMERCEKRDFSSSTWEKIQSTET